MEWESRFLPSAMKRLGMRFAKRSANIARANEQKEIENLVRRKHDLEQHIERLKSLPSDPGRTKTIRQLRKQLKAL